MINRTPAQLAALIGRSVMHQHMASDDVYGPVKVIDVHLGSDSVVVSGDVNTGRCYSLLASVTLFHPASATPEPQP